MPFLHVHCPCGRVLRARPDQAGTVIRCWDCGQDVVVPVPARTGLLIRRLGDALRDSLRSETVGVVFAGAVLLTLVLLVPRAGVWLALGLMAAAALWGYGGQVRAAGLAPARDEAGPVSPWPAPEAGPPQRRRWMPVVQALLACAAVLALVAPVLVRNRGRALPPAVGLPGVVGLMALALVGWLLMPLALAAAHAHDARGPMRPREALAALARHPLATSLAVLLLPLGLLAAEVLGAAIAWQQNRLPLLVADLFPAPQLVQLDDGPHIRFNYDGYAIDARLGDFLNAPLGVYGRGLRRGFTLVGTVPPSLSVGLTQVRQEAWLFKVEPVAYLLFRMALTLLFLGSAGVLLMVQARWLGLIAALGAAPHRPRSESPTTVSAD